MTRASVHTMDTKICNLFQETDNNHYSSICLNTYNFSSDDVFFDADHEQRVCFDKRGRWI